TFRSRVVSRASAPPRGTTRIRAITSRGNSRAKRKGPRRRSRRNLPSCTSRRSSPQRRRSTSAIAATPPTVQRASQKRTKAPMRSAGPGWRGARPEESGSPLIKATAPLPSSQSAKASPTAQPQSQKIRKPELKKRPTPHARKRARRPSDVRSVAMNLLSAGHVSMMTHSPWLLPSTQPRYTRTRDEIDSYVQIGPLPPNRHRAARAETPDSHGGSGRHAFLCLHDRQGASRRALSRRVRRRSVALCLYWRRLGGGGLRVAREPRVASVREGRGHSIQSVPRDRLQHPGRGDSADRPALDGRRFLRLDGQPGDDAPAALLVARARRLGLAARTRHISTVRGFRTVGRARRGGVCGLVDPGHGVHGSHVDAFGAPHRVVWIVVRRRAAPNASHNGA